MQDQTLEIMTYDNRKLENTFQHNYTDADYGLGWLPTRVLEQIKVSSDDQQLLDEEWDRLKTIKQQICSEVYPDGETKQHIPINIARLLDRARNRVADEDGTEAQERYSPMEIVQKVESLLKQLEVTRAIAEGDTIGREVEDNAKIVLNAHLRCALASRKILEKDQRAAANSFAQCKECVGKSEKLSKQSFDWLIGEVKQKFMKSLVHPVSTSIFLSTMIPESSRTHVVLHPEDTASGLLLEQAENGLALAPLAMLAGLLFLMPAVAAIRARALEILMRA
eukprot:s2587_g3.t1